MSESIFQLFLEVILELLANFFARPQIPNEERSGTGASKDFYRELGVAPDASDEDIKRAYRQMVLIHHPDKNPDDFEGATRRFLRIQEAYEVGNDAFSMAFELTCFETLIDRQRRIQYDRDQMFTEGSGDHGSSFPGSSLTPDEVLSRYDPAKYKLRMGNTPVPGMSPFDIIQYMGILFATPVSRTARDSFIISGIRNLFECLAYDELLWGSKKCIPSYGSIDSVWCHEDIPRGEQRYAVKKFYDHWIRFSTAKRFDWITPFDCPPYDRDTQRYARMLNKPYQDYARQCYNDCITTLVEALKERDPRYQAHLAKDGKARGQQETPPKASGSGKRNKKKKKKKGGSSTTW